MFFSSAYQERDGDFPQDFEIDEETKFSAVCRDDYTYDRNNDTLFDSSNTQNSGGSLDSVDISELKKNDGAQISSSSSHLVFSLYHHSYLLNDH